MRNEVAEKKLRPLHPIFIRFFIRRAPPSVQAAFLEQLEYPPRRQLKSAEARLLTVSFNMQGLLKKFLSNNKLGGLIMVSPIVTTYVDAALAQLRRRDLMRWPGTLPDSMRDDSIPPSGDWIGWKAIPSTVTDADLDILERETELPFPPLYRDFLRYRHFVDLTEVGVRFERHLSNDWSNVLRKAFFQSWPRERILDIGLLPFGSEAQMDAGPVCFDSKRRSAAGDCRVVFWDHEWVGTEKEVRPLFSSSARMFECLCTVATNDVNFVDHNDSDDPALLPKKRALLAKFLSIDPEGAGGPAREYWTCWGVTPAA